MGRSVYFINTYGNFHVIAMFFCVVFTVSKSDIYEMCRVEWKSYLISYIFFYTKSCFGLSQWPRDLRHELSSLARTLGS
jgi:hypothetical protein